MYQKLQGFLGRIFLMNRSVTAFLLSALMLILSFGAPAFAALERIGPIDATNGFPTTVTDTNGVTLGINLDLLHGSITPDMLPNPSVGISFPTNWPDEIFWYTVDSALTFASPNGGAGSASLVMAIEGAFGGGAVLAGDQIMFSRIRFKAAGLVAGASYTVTHPYGVINVVAEADGTVFTTDDCGMGAPGNIGDYVRILPCPIGPFLKVVSPAPPGRFSRDHQ